jgi:hypothetical protein
MIPYSILLVIGDVSSWRTGAITGGACCASACGRLFASVAARAGGSVGGIRTDCLGRMFVRSSEWVVIDALEPVIPMPHDLVKSKGRNLRKDSGSLFTNFVNDFRKDYSDSDSP